MSKALKKLGILLIATQLVGCTVTEEVQVTNEQVEEQVEILCTTFPVYDWLNTLVGEVNETIEVTLLTEGGIDFHSYQPSIQDIVAISESDVVIYIGGESDRWVEEILVQNPKENQLTINLMEQLQDYVKEEEFVEGMQHEEHSHEEHSHEEHSHEAHDHEEHSHEAHNHEEHSHEEHVHVENSHAVHTHEGVYDEHIWLSLRNAEAICEVLVDTLISVDKKNEAMYTQNFEVYSEQLQVLDRRYEEVVGGSERQTILYADRFPFRYLVDDYGIDYYAAFSGCSAETEASFETVVFLTEQVNKLALPVILYVDESNKSIADTVSSSSEVKNQEILKMETMEAIGHKAIESGASYLSFMEENLKVLEHALN